MYLLYRQFYRTNSRTSLHSDHFGGGGGLVSDSSEVEEPLHFTSTVTSSTRGPGGQSRNTRNTAPSSPTLKPKDIRSVRKNVTTF
jgi:hypothetical protein